MYRVLLAATLLTAFFVGCTTNSIVPNASKVVSSTPVKAQSTTQTVGAELYDKNWISPAIVKVGNYYPGARAEHTVSVHNGRDVPSRFLVSVRAPDNAKEGYEKSSRDVVEWVTISEGSPLLDSKETRDVLIVLEIPKAVQVPYKKWEFWISITEQTGRTLVAEMVSRWLVEMK